MIFVNESYLADITVTTFACNLYWICGMVGEQNINAHLRGSGNAREFLKQLEKDFGSFKVFDMSERIAK